MPRLLACCGAGRLAISLPSAAPAGPSICQPTAVYLLANCLLATPFLFDAQMKDGWRAKEDLVDQVVALFRTKVFRPGA